jgi:hypothetical protein
MRQVSALCGNTHAFFSAEIVVHFDENRRFRGLFHFFWYFETFSPCLGRVKYSNMQKNRLGDVTMGTNRRSIPEVFRGRFLRSGVKYRDLRGHLYTSEERLWLCEQSLGVGTDGGDDVLVLRGNRVRGLAERYHLDVNLLKLWIAHYKKGTLVEYSEAIWQNHRGWPGPPA